LSTPPGDRPSVVVNGEERALTRGATILTLLRELELDPRTVAVEHNGTVRKRDDFAAAGLEEGDRLEIVRFVQGGSGGGAPSDRRLAGYC
jgi:thiamine biosynthesis protein ThiS